MAAGGGGGFSHCQEGYMPGLMRLKDHIKSLSASLPAGGSTDLAAWRWGAARPPLWSLETGACQQPSHRIYSPHPWQEDTRWCINTNSTQLVFCIYTTTNFLDKTLNRTLNKINLNHSVKFHDSMLINSHIKVSSLEIRTPVSCSLISCSM